METRDNNPVKAEKPLKKKRKKWFRNALIILFVALGIFVYIRFFFVFGTGVKAGQLNYVVYKGYMFKTYEGKLIQPGYKSAKVTGPIQSYEFEFSIADKKIADQLMVAGGQDVELHYKEYFGMVPWRGYSKYVVDSIIAIR